MVRFGDVQAGDSGQVYLTAKLSTSPWRARAAMSRSTGENENVRLLTDLTKWSIIRVSSFS